ncbi:MAG: antibiotic biosynthesis monooxygenase [Lachnospiraceae bacterium]|nr:antibiotic biosynthesis monooxygenase [Lachnospiraceae bacterium]
MITVNIYYKGSDGAARIFAEDMVANGVVDRIRKEPGNIRYEYFFPMDDPETVLLIDSWKDQSAIDRHHASPMMGEIMKLRQKYDLHMKVDRFISDDGIPESDQAFITK